MKHTTIDQKLFQGNRKTFSKYLQPKAVAIFNSNDEYPRNGDQLYPYRQQSDFFYLTGINQEKSILLVAPDHPEPKNREILFLIKTNEQMVIWNGHKLTIQEAEEISGIANVQWLDNFEMVLRDLMVWSEKVYLNTYEYPKYSSDILSRDQRFAQDLKVKFPAHQYCRSAPVLLNMRMIKSKTEIELIQKAINITEKAFRRMLKFVKPGVKEYEIQAEMEHEFVMNGATGSAYQPIVASGANSCVLHYIQNNNICKNGEVILFDFGAEYANYAADVSRTIPVNGKFNPRQRELYELVLRAQKKAIKQMVVGNTMEKYNKSVSKLMAGEMIKIGLLSKEDVKKQDPEKPLYKKYFMHGTAHHMGLDVHDVVDRHQPFSAGMVFTCEPGIYLGDEEIGIRIENNILITENGPVDLTENIPREVGEIEGLMEGRG
ncbi:MAG: X-Pro aminopeptidase [Bacteroidetes bacterium 4484_276]|nr:MAG: X-Pro aminopeptidase [Bacteroidetes bacterium 4484_276]OYT13516.1 MAG: X-Pro aminopeptidase [Bacteroidetes bacterium 4572_114]